MPFPAPAKLTRERGDHEREAAMITHLPDLPLPTGSTLDINIRVTQPLNITSFSARQRVTQYVMHQLSTQLVSEHEGICLEDLSVRGLARTKLAKSILDASWGEFRRQMGYKTVWNRKHLAMVDRFYPSSKTCHVCGAVNASLTLADRTWTCVCGILHDRDLNAARNILSEGLKQIPLAAGHAESLNVRGPGIRPLAGAIGDEARIPRV